MSRFALLALGFLWGCTAADRYRTHERPAGSKITVLVPGYRGSFLYERDRRVYLNPEDAFVPGRETLGTCADGMRPLEPGGPMTTFSIWPYDFHVYGSFMRWADEHLTGFTAWGYDWRLSLPDTAARLCAFIGEHQANLIGHSMGGLVVILAVQQCPERISGAVFAGAPFRGAPGILKDLFWGSRTNQNVALLSPEALWTFPATWQLLPRTDDFFVDAQGRPATVPISQAATWAKWPMPCPARLGERLADRAKMPLEFARAPARSLAVIGRGLPTTQAVRVAGDFFDLDRPASADGDGAVAASNATPPFESEQVFTAIEHTNLLDDPHVRKTVEAFLNPRPEPPSP